MLNRQIWKTSQVPTSNMSFTPKFAFVRGFFQMLHLNRAPLPWASHLRHLSKLPQYFDVSLMFLNKTRELNRSLSLQTKIYNIFCVFIFIFISESSWNIFQKQNVSQSIPFYLQLSERSLLFCKVAYNNSLSHICCRDLSISALFLVQLQAFRLSL